MTKWNSDKQANKAKTAMSENEPETGDGPLQNISDERQAIREELPQDIHVLIWYGGEPFVALVQREKAPSEFSNKGETIVLVEWPGQEKYAISVAKGEETGWELTDELVSMHEKRDEAIEAATKILKEN